MPEIDLPFSRQEYAARLARVRAAMDKAGFEVLLCTDPSNMAWLTGYDGWSFYVHQGVIVSPTGDPVFWGRGMDANGAKRTCYMGADDIIGYDDDYVMSPTRHPMQDLANRLRERGWDRHPLAVEMENYYFSARAHQVLLAELGPTQDATGLVNRLRAVKSRAEIGFMRRAARILEKMHRTIFDLAAPGIPKNRIAAEVFRTGILGASDETGDFGGDYPAIVPLMPSGTDASAAHLTWDDRPLKTGEATFFEIAGCYRRYHCPMSRTIFLGQPPDDMLAAEQAVLEGIERGINAARPGNTAGQVAQTFYDVLAHHGIERSGRCGYPIGLSYPPDWGERSFSIRQGDDTVLEPNMTFHFMPGLWKQSWGLEITETLRIRQTGPAEPLASVPRRLQVKP